MSVLLAAVCVFFSGHTLIHATPTGAPESACVDMLPDHGVPPQDSNPPFSLTVTSLGDGLFEVTLASNGGTGFEGFFIQARRSAGTWHGLFLDDGDRSIQPRPCPEAEALANGVTHIGPQTKQEVTTVWDSLGEDTTGVFIQATVAASQTVFWVDLTQPIP